MPTDDAQTIHRTRPQDGPQRAFSSCSADVAIYGGAAGGGKTWALVAEPLYHAKNAEFSALILRRTFPEIFQPGGPWVEGESMYSPSFATPIMSQPRGPAWIFPSGAVVKFDHLHRETDKYRYQGGQIPLIMFDQLEHFSESQFWYMFSRSRSTCGVRPYIRATCNPEPGWLSDLLEWWIDPISGYPIPERSGVVRWFVRVGDEIHWASTPDELHSRFDGATVVPKSLAFIAATLDDNQILKAKDPGYVSNLMALPSVQRERLLRGNWLIQDLDGTEWDATYFDDIYCDEAEWPDAFDAYVVALDGSKGRTKRSDFSAIVGVGLCGGKLYVDADIQRRPAERIISDVCDFSAMRWPDAFGVESNGFQDLFDPLIQNEQIRRGIPPLPIHTIHNSAHKEVRIRRLGPYLDAGLFRVRRHAGGKRLVEQMRGFPLSDVHDDGPDATEMAIRLLVNLCRVGYNAPSDILIES